MFKSIKCMDELKFLDCMFEGRSKQKKKVKI